MRREDDSATALVLSESVKGSYSKQNEEVLVRVLVFFLFVK